MQIPWNQLSPDTLVALIEEFITREGTEYGASEIPLDQKVVQIKNQLSKGEVVIVYDPDTQSSNIVLSVEAAQQADSE